MEGVVLINLGTPKAPNVRSVRKYLHEFLTDYRVIRAPWIKRQLLVRGIIVPNRVRESTMTYQKVWTEEGSPLLVYGKRVKKDLQQALGGEYVVSLGMRYQEPSIQHALDAVKHCKKITVIPLFPQYASATTGSVQEEVMRILSRWECIPEMHFIHEFATNPGFIEAFTSQIPHIEYDHALISFHGLPMKQLPYAQCSLGTCCNQLSSSNHTCYGAQCFATAKALAEKAGFSSYSVSFQSRLGKDPWMQPFTSEVVVELAKKGIRKLLVLCPSFVADCLETIYEIGEENREIFKENGGEELYLSPCPNDNPLWVEALMSMVKSVSHENVTSSL